MQHLPRHRKEEATGQPEGQLLAGHCTVTELHQQLVYRFGWN